MYKVLIADDEPPFIRSLKRMLDKYASNFTVVGEAYNGVDALEKVIALRPDIVFTDIKMPGLNGIELIKNIERKAPETLCVIISGYQDFNFAREAMKTIAVEYLLKPLEPDMLSEVLMNLADKLDDRLLVRAQAVLQSIATGKGDVSEADRALFEPCDRWMSTVLYTAGEQEAVNTFGIACADLFRARDERGVRFYRLADAAGEEQVVLAAWKAGVDGRAELGNRVRRAFSVAQNCGALVTAALGSTPVELHELRVQIARLRETVRAGIVIGRSRLIETVQAQREECARLLDSVVQNNLRYLLQNRQFDEIANELDRLFIDWENQLHPKATIKPILWQIVMLAQEASTAPYNPARVEQLFVLALGESVSYIELKKEIMEIISVVLENPDESTDREERQRTLITRMSEYVQSNLGQVITLQTVCNAFALSQPTVSRLFRECFGKSFNEYLTDMRMNHAKRLMKEQPEMKLRAIAEIVGYADQHYFSRKFKQVTGKSPSDYLISTDE